MPKRPTSGRWRAAFAGRLKRLRIDAGLTQSDLERLSGIPKSRISRYENGHLLPSFQGLRKLAASLGVTDSALLGEGEEPYTIFVNALRRHGIEIGSADEAEDIASRVAGALEHADFAEAKTAIPPA